MHLNEDGHKQSVVIGIIATPRLPDDTCSLIVPRRAGPAASTSNSRRRQDDTMPHAAAAPAATATSSDANASATATAPIDTTTAVHNM